MARRNKRRRTDNPSQGAEVAVTDSGVPSALQALPGIEPQVASKLITALIASTSGRNEADPAPSRLESHGLSVQELKKLSSSIIPALEETPEAKERLSSTFLLVSHVLKGIRHPNDVVTSSPAILRHLMDKLATDFTAATNQNAGVSRETFLYQECQIAEASAHVLSTLVRHGGGLKANRFGPSEEQYIPIEWIFTRLLQPLAIFFQGQISQFLIENSSSGASSILAGISNASPSEVIEAATLLLDYSDITTSSDAHSSTRCIITLRDLAKSILCLATSAVESSTRGSLILSTGIVEKGLHEWLAHNDAAVLQMLWLLIGPELGRFSRSVISAIPGILIPEARSKASFGQRTLLVLLETVASKLALAPVPKSVWNCDAILKGLSETLDTAQVFIRSVVPSAGPSARAHYDSVALELAHPVLVTSPSTPHLHVLSGVPSIVANFPSDSRWALHSSILKTLGSLLIIPRSTFAQTTVMVYAAVGATLNDAETRGHGSEGYNRYLATLRSLCHDIESRLMRTPGCRQRLKDPFATVIQEYWDVIKERTTLIQKSLIDNGEEESSEEEATIGSDVPEEESDGGDAGIKQLHLEAIVSLIDRYNEPTVLDDDEDSDSSDGARECLKRPHPEEVRLVDDELTVEDDDGDSDSSVGLLDM